MESETGSETCMAMKIRPCKGPVMDFQSTLQNTKTWLPCRRELDSQSTPGRGGDRTGTAEAYFKRRKRGAVKGAVKNGWRHPRQRM